MKTIDEIMETLRHEGSDADKKALVQAYAEALSAENTVGLQNKNSELIGKLKDAKVAAESHQGELDALKAKGEKDMAPMELQLSRMATDMESFKTERDEAKADSAKKDALHKRDQINRSLQSAAAKAKVRPEAIDRLVSTASNDFDIDASGHVVNSDGSDPGKWLTGIKDSESFWWPASQGAGATGNNGAGSNGVNPWSKDSWNLTKQAEYIRDNDSGAAEGMARSAKARMDTLEYTPT